ncbi:N-acetylmuramoyl-L-alanine amidase family protein [Lacrimispora aerotolerans]|jgi:N-acetylmuramoyl-L-alanine amidase|uniref:N-acetylmuramoyl-L-alanine amidase family protein n=1 Tax=Lacrimispora aerotolerans TaxID=36832 RepID=UPI00047CA593|nr:N-acetylmuramoyl-L-alanine amidase [Lacrimispora aerotolerans]
MINFKNVLTASASALLLATIISTTAISTAYAEEETGPAFAPPITKISGPEIGPGANRSSKLVVVLDPGHGKVDGHYSGCNFEYNGVKYYEDEINMKISTYTKKYLEENTDYAVYLTKDSVEKTVPLEQRAAFAASVHADLFVSQHVDSAPGNGVTKNAYGVSSMAPKTGRFNNELALQSQEAANTILGQLSSIGLHNRGLILRDSQNGTMFPDGSLADYYAIPRYSQMYGIRGFIIEHGFINHTSDLTSYLSTEESYKALGEADAKGIIEYLKKAGKSTFTPSTEAAQVPPVEGAPVNGSSGPAAAAPQTGSQNS